MDLEPLAQKKKEYIERELGMWVEVRHCGNGYSFYPISPTGRIMGETRMVTSMTLRPIVFTYNRGYFTGREGMALATRFRDMLAEEEQNRKDRENIFELTQDMRIDTVSPQDNPADFLVYPFVKDDTAMTVDQS